MIRERILLGLVVAACAGAPQAGLAADFITPTAPIAPMAAAYNWSGGYLGGQLGYGMSQMSVGTVSFFDDPAAAPTGVLPIGPFNFSGNGVIGGAEAGYNWQAGRMLFGIEGDISAADVRGTFTDTGDNFSIESDLSWLSTARLRIGLPMDRFLLFATGGVAVGGVTANLRDSYPTAAPPATFNTSSSNVSVGWTIGGGFAAAVTDHWTIKAEYLYADLGSHAYTFSEPDPPGWALISTNARTTASIVRVGMDYKF